MENRRVVLASRPQGAVSEDNFRIESAPLPECGEGEVLVRNLWLSLDPYMRGRMSDAKSYAKGVELGAIMGGQTVGEVQAACPKGADVYFDNVGGKMLDAMLRITNLFARIVVCGMIADYSATQPYAVKNLRSVLVNRIKMQGMIVFDWKERYGEALKPLGEYLAQGKLKYRESIVEGLENAPRGLIALLGGRNFGKQLVKLA